MSSKFLQLLTKIMKKMQCGPRYYGKSASENQNPQNNWTMYIQWIVFKYIFPLQGIADYESGKSQQLFFTVTYSY